MLFGPSLSASSLTSLFLSGGLLPRFFQAIRKHVLGVGGGPAIGQHLIELRFICMEPHEKFTQVIRAAKFRLSSSQKPGPQSQRNKFHMCPDHDSESHQRYRCKVAVLHQAARGADFHPQCTRWFDPKKKSWASCSLADERLRSFAARALYFLNAILHLIDPRNRDSGSRSLDGGSLLNISCLPQVRSNLEVGLFPDWLNVRNAA